MYKDSFVKKHLALHQARAQALPTAEGAYDRMLQCLAQKNLADALAYWSQGVMPSSSAPLEPLVYKKEVPELLFFFQHYGGTLDDQAGGLLFRSAMGKKIKNCTALLELCPTGAWSKAAYLGVLALLSSRRFSTQERRWKIAHVLMPYVPEERQDAILQMARHFPDNNGSFARLEHMMLETKIPPAEDSKKRAFL